MSAVDLAAAEKPLLRGVFHEVAAFVALAGWLALASAASSGAARVAAHVYGASLSPSSPPAPPTTVRAGRRRRARMRRLDHSAIFLLIAGTYTPFCLLLGGSAGRALLAVVWAGALLGVLQSILWVQAPRAVVAAIAVALGWAVVPVLPSLSAALGTGAIALLGAGGLAYTLGAVIYARRRPDPFPRIFGYHEVFHALVVVAAACHFAVVAAALRSIG
jgi:hemolysin III